jgi:hypothetical protein
MNVAVDDGEVWQLYLSSQVSRNSVIEVWMILGKK